MEEIMKNEENRLKFEDFADNKGFDLSIDFFDLKGDPNPFTDNNTRLAYEIWCASKIST